MGTDRTGVGISGTDTIDAALAGVDITGIDAIGPGLIDVDITGKALAGMSTTCVVIGPAAIIGPGITIRPMCTLHMFTYLASTCTSCFLCTDDRASIDSAAGSPGVPPRHRHVGSDRIDIGVEQGHAIGLPSLLYLKGSNDADGITVSVGGGVNTRSVLRGLADTPATG